MSTNTTECGIVLYSSQVFCNLFKKDITTATSSKILTWQQVMTNKKIETIFPIMMELYEEQKLLQKSSRSIIVGCCFYFYQMYDVKLIYLLSQHTHWSRNMKAFLLYNCDKGDRV